MQNAQLKKLEDKQRKKIKGSKGRRQWRTKTDELEYRSEN